MVPRRLAVVCRRAALMRVRVTRLVPWLMLVLWCLTMLPMVAFVRLRLTCPTVVLLRLTSNP